MPRSHQGWTAPSGSGVPCPLAAEFAAGLDEVERLCHELEALADSLPLRVDAARAVLLMGGLRALLRRAHRLEEASVFPVLLAGEPMPGLGPAIARLAAEHAEDEDLAADLEEALAAFAGPPARGEAERVGYMLRCLFLGLRRHVAFERDHLGPLLAAGPVTGPRRGRGRRGP